MNRRDSSVRKIVEEALGESRRSAAHVTSSNVTHRPYIFIPFSQ